MSQAKCPHGFVICSRCIIATDAGRRMADTINLKVISHTWEELARGWMVFSLADGSSDNVLYDSKQTAAKFTDEKRNGYFCFASRMAGMDPRDATILLQFWRHAAAAGIPMAEPDVKRQPDLIISTYGMDVLRGRIDPRAN